MLQMTNVVPYNYTRFADDLVESSDGTLYFSVASTKFGLHDWQLDVLEAKPHGQLLKYDPSLNETSIVLDNLGFANGVALSQDQDYLIVCESWKYRCLKYWLKGEFKGKTEIFIDNLPGGPDNIKLAPDGSFWIALLEVLYTKNCKRKAMVVNVGIDGRIIRGFDDPTGKVMAFVTSVLEYEDHLYLGNLHCDFIGKLPLINSST
ncbi:hypothetical protein ACJIZ3_021467 [Penstemon smallii]|uniref:Strictosidine synthase conserved region domain-containing protein n=1 Tax=Penstemon smallii TaxID=265156 RepID=A0ABD3SM87_9LAMI